MGCAPGQPRSSSAPLAGQSCVTCQTPPLHVVLRAMTRPSAHVTAYEHIAPASLHDAFGCGSSQHARVHVPASAGVAGGAPDDVSDELEEHASTVSAARTRPGAAGAADTRASFR